MSVVKKKNKWITLFITGATIRWSVWMLMKTTFVRSLWNSFTVTNTLGIMLANIFSIEAVNEILLFVGNIVFGIPGCAIVIGLCILKRIVHFFNNSGVLRIQEFLEEKARFKTKPVMKSVYREYIMVRDYGYNNGVGKEKLIDIGRVKSCSVREYGLRLKVQDDGDVDIYQYGEYVSTINESRNKYKDSDKQLELEYLRPEFKEPRNMGIRTLPKGVGLAHNSDGLLVKVPFSKMCWEVIVNSNDINNGIKFYIDVKRRIIGYEGVVCKAPGKKNIIIERVYAIRKINKLISEMIVDFTVDGIRYSKKLMKSDRVYKGELKNNYAGHLIDDSGYYPTTIAALVGPVSTGKTSFVYAAHNDLTKKKLKDLLPVSYLSPSTRNVHPKPVRTLLNSVKTYLLEVTDQGGIAGIIYLVDLSGELTLMHGNAGNSDVISFKGSVNMSVEDQKKADAIIANVIDMADAMLIFDDNRTLIGKTVNGDSLNVLKYLNKNENIEQIHICTKMDLIKKECESKPVRDWHGYPVLTANNPIFRSASRRASSDSSMTATEAAYQHMAIASMIMEKTGLTFGNGDACFMITSQKPEESSEKGEDMVNDSREVNVELVMAYLISRSFGYKFK